MAQIPQPVQIKKEEPGPGTNQVFLQQGFSPTEEAGGNTPEAILFQMLTCFEKSRFFKKVGIADQFAGDEAKIAGGGLCFFQVFR